MEKNKLIEKIKRLLDSGNTTEALEIVEELDKKKLKNLSEVNTVAECYIKNNKYYEAKQMLLRIYDQCPSRRVLSQLVHLSIQLKEIEEAKDWFEEFKKVSEGDFYEYIFQYRIDKLEKAPLETLIIDLEQLKKNEYIENWAYELAKLYYKIGNKEKCIEECNDIILWFGNGEYVERAKALRAYYTGELQLEEILQNEGVQAKDEEIKTSIIAPEGKVVSEEKVVPEEKVAPEEKVIHEEISVQSEQDNKEQQSEFNIPKENGVQFEQLSNQQLIGENNPDFENELENKQINLYSIFGNFIRMESVRRQLIRSFEQILVKRNGSVHVIITGDQESGNLILAKDYAKFLYYMGFVLTSKVAIISGEKLNELDILKQQQQLENCVLLISHANKMNKNTVKNLLKLCGNGQSNVAMILTDTREQMNQMLRNHNAMNSVFNNRIHLHKYSLEEYMGFAYDYIKNCEYEIEPDAFKKLQNGFQELLKKENKNQLDTCLNMIQKMIDSAEIRNNKLLLSLSKEGKITSENIMILKKEDIIF